MKNDNLIKTLLILVVVAVLALFAFHAAWADEIPRMTKENLKKMLGSDDLVLLDVRTGRDWKSSEFKIKGAVRGDPGEVDQWAGKYSKDRTFVLYCA